MRALSAVPDHAKVRASLNLDDERPSEAAKVRGAEDSPRASSSSSSSSSGAESEAASPRRGVSFAADAEGRHSAI